MELIILGSGTGVPYRRRGAPGYAVLAAGKLIVLDLGAGTLRALAHHALDFSGIDLLAITHLHPDHVGDLVPFFFATHYSLGYYRVQPFILAAARGFRDFHERLKIPFGHWVEPPPGKMDLRELDPEGPDGLEIPGVRLRSAPTRHIPGSLAYRLEADGGSLVYSGDTEFCDSLVELARGADVLLCECAMPYSVPGHMSPEEAGRLAAQAGVKRLVLTHFYPPCDGVNVVSLAAKAFPGEIIRAEDDMRLPIPG